VERPPSRPITNGRPRWSETPRQRPGRRSLSWKSGHARPNLEVRGIGDADSRRSIGDAVGVRGRKSRYVSTFATVTSTASWATGTSSTSTYTRDSGGDDTARLAG